MINSIPYNSFPASTAQFEEGKNDAIQAEIDAIKDSTNIDSFGDVETALALKANSTDMTTALATKTDLSNIAPTFDAESGTYEIGEQVIYDGVLYEFTSAHSTAGEWDSLEVQAVKISELIDTLKSGLNNVDDELTVYRKRYNGGDLWAGDTLTFANISVSSNIVYHFVAIDTTASGTPESAYLLVKTTGVQVYGKVGTFTTAYDDEHNTLTITLPASSYWAYRLEIVARRND